MCTSANLPKNAAVVNCSLFSKALILIKVLAHNLFHKICEEACCPGPGIGLVRDGTIPALTRRSLHGAVGWAVALLPIFCSRRAFSFNFKRLGLNEASLLTSFSTVCVQSGLHMCVTRAA